MIPDFPYNVLPVPGMTLGLRLSSSVDSAKIAVVIPELWKAFAPINVTEDGIVMDVIPVIPWKALAPMLFTEEGMVIDVKPVIPWKALAPMLVTEDGIVMDVTVVAF